MANLTEREKRDKFREEAIDNHMKLFGNLFCRICGHSRRYMHAHHTVIPYKDDDSTSGYDNSTLIGGYCHREIHRNGAVDELREQFSENPVKGTYDVFQCPFGAGYDVNAKNK